VQAGHFGHCLGRAGQQPAPLGELIPAGGERAGQLVAEPGEQFLAGRAGRDRDTIQGQRVEEDPRLQPAGQLRQLDQRPPGDRAERLDIGIPGDPSDVQQGQVDIPQNQAMNGSLRGRSWRGAPASVARREQPGPAKNRVTESPREGRDH
jgi:hypothetical protein